MRGSARTKSAAAVKSSAVPKSAAAINVDGTVNSKESLQRSQDRIHENDSSFGATPVRSYFINKVLSDRFFIEQGNRIVLVTAASALFAIVYGFLHSEPRIEVLFSFANAVFGIALVIIFLVRADSK